MNAARLALELPLDMGLHLAPDFRARIGGVQRRVLAQQFLGAFIVHLRSLHNDLDDLVAARRGSRILHALLAHTELLSVLGALRNLELRPAIDGGYLDRGAQASLVDTHRDSDQNVIRIAPE